MPKINRDKLISHSTQFLWKGQNIKSDSYFISTGFGGLGVACWPLVPKFGGSNPAEAVGFLRLPSEGK